MEWLGGQMTPLEAAAPLQSGADVSLGGGGFVPIVAAAWKQVAQSAVVIASVRIDLSMCVSLQAVPALP
jgi:hypothetical protein